MTNLVHANPHHTAAGHMPSQAMQHRITDSGEKSRPLAGMLLAAGMAALLVTADQVIDNWSDGHLLAAWVALWTVTFAALAILATPLRKLSNAGAAWVSAYRKASEERRQEEEMWELARHDHRVMADIRTACLRQTQG